jgi:hypothetical protein
MGGDGFLWICGSDGRGRLGLDGSAWLLVGSVLIEDSFLVVSFGETALE